MSTRDEVLAEYMDRPDTLSAMADRIAQQEARIRELEAANDDGQKYAVTLHRIIEAHYRGERVSDSASPHIAAMLNAQLVSKSYTSAASEPVAWVSGIIEKHLGYTNGWAVSGERYLEDCQDAAREILAGLPHPSAAGVTVTEAMVEVAAICMSDAWHEGEIAWADLHENVKTTFRTMARDSLTAALTAASEGASA